MNENEFKKKCEDLLALEQYIVSLQGYKKKEKLRFGKMLKNAWRSLVALIFILIVVGILKYLEIQLKKMGGYVDLFLFCVVIFKFTGYASLIFPLLGFNENEGVIKFLRQTLTLAFQNKKREEANREHETEVKLAQESWEILQKELLSYSHSNAKPEESGKKITGQKFFFDIPFHPEQREDMLMSKIYGVTHWYSKLLNEELATEVLAGLYGSIKAKKDENGNLRLDGISQGCEVTNEKIDEIFSDDYMVLYADMDGEEPVRAEQYQIYKICEIVVRRLKETTRYRTIESYDAEKATDKFNSDVDMLLNANVIDITEANVIREKGEKRIQNMSKPITTSSHSTCSIIGEELLILEKGYVLFSGDRLAAVCVPKGKAVEWHIAYKLDRELHVDVVKWDTKKIPEDARFHGKIMFMESRQVHPNPYSTAQYVVNYLGNYLKSFDGLEEFPDDMGNKSEWNVWRYFMQQRFKKDSVKRWGRKECEELVGKPKEESLSKEYRRKTALNAVLDVLVFLFLAWGIASVTDILPEKFRFGPVEKAWKSIMDDEWKFAQKAKGLKFDAGCYQRVINDKTNANIASSDERRSAAVAGDKLWVNDWTGISWYGKDNMKGHLVGDNYYCGERAAPMLNDGEFGYASFLTEKGESYAVVFDREEIEKGYRETIAQGWAEDYKENNSFTFSSVSGQLYSILKKQETEALNPKEMAGLLYFSSKGTVLDYQAGTAIFADDMTDLGTVHIYRQNEDGQEELFSYLDDYEGSGAGRFVVEDMIVYAEKLSVSYYRPEKTEDQWGLMMESDTPVLALNYAYGETYGLNVLALCENSLTMLIPSGKRRGDISLDETYESLFTIENQILIRSKPEGEFNSKQGQPYYKMSLN